MSLAARSSTSRASEYRNIKTAFSTDRVCPPPATLLPLVPAPDVGPPPSHRPPWRAPHQGVPEAPRATGRHPAPQGTDRTGGWGRAAGAAGGGCCTKPGDLIQRALSLTAEHWQSPLPLTSHGAPRDRTGATMTGLTAALAEFIHVKTLDDVPPEALDKAKKAIADTFAVMLAGAGSEVAPPLLLC